MQPKRDIERCRGPFLAAYVALALLTVYGQEQVQSAAQATEAEGLTKPICEQISKLQICSERASALELAMEESTLDSFRALWEAGFLCYNMEFVATKDLQMVAANAKRLRWAVEELEPGNIPWPSTHYTIKQLRELGASIYQLPTLDQFLRDLRRRLAEANLHNLEFKDTDIRLVEPHYELALLRQTVATANRHRATSLFVLALDSQAQAEFVRKMGLWEGKTMRMFVANTTAEMVGSEDLGAYTVLGAPATAPAEVLRMIRDSGKLFFATGVETEGELLRALEQGFSGVSTTLPMHLQQVLHKWRAECQAKDLNLASLPDSRWQDASAAT